MVSIAYQFHKLFDSLGLPLDTAFQTTIMKPFYILVLLTFLITNCCYGQSFKDLENKDLIGDNNEYFRFADDTAVYVYLKGDRYLYGTYYVRGKKLFITRKKSNYTRKYKILLQNQDSLFICSKTKNFFPAEEKQDFYYDTIRLVTHEKQIFPIKKVKYIELSYIYLGPWSGEKILIDSIGRIWRNARYYDFKDTTAGKLVYTLSSEELQILIKLLENSSLQKLRSERANVDGLPLIRITIAVDNTVYTTRYEMPDFIHRHLYRYLHSIYRTRETQLNLFNKESMKWFYEF